MPRLVVNAWGVVVDFVWGVADGIIDATWNQTNSTDLEHKVVNLCHGGALASTSKELIRNLVIDVALNFNNLK